MALQNTADQYTPLRQQALDHLNNRRFEQVAELLQPLLMHTPPDWKALNLLGNCELEQQRYDHALSFYQQAYEQVPDSYFVNHNIGNVLLKLDRAQDALPYLYKAAEVDPKAALTRRFLVDALFKLKRWKDAIEQCEVLYQLEPNAVNACDIGHAYHESDQMAKARDWWLSVLPLYEEHSPLHSHIGGVLYATGFIDEALKHYQRATQLLPEEGVIRSNYVMMLNYTEHPHSSILQAHKNWINTQQDLLGTPPMPARHIARDRKPRVGYVSPDFHNHPVGQLIIPALLLHDSSRFDFYIFKSGTDDDNLTQQLRDHFGDRFVECGTMDTYELLDCIRAHDIDILIDLSGHTGGNRLSVFARRAAPIQMTYLGYPNTTGLDTMDYRITDNYADPQGIAEFQHSEIPLRMDAPFLCLQEPSVLPPITTQPALTNGFITLSCFNNLAKVSGFTLNMWAEIMQQLPTAKLIIKAAPLRDPVLMEEQKTRFKSHGIDPDRVTFHARMAFWDHMALYNHIDLALDPFPYNGTATTIEAIWMGVPVLTLAGGNHVSRVGNSIMRSLGLEAFVASNRADYIERCIFFAHHPEIIARVRMHLRQTMRQHPAASPAHLAHKLEGLYESVIR